MWFCWQNDVLDMNTFIWRNVLFYHDSVICYILNTVFFATNFSTCNFESHDIEPMYWNGIACRTNSFIDRIKMPETERYRNKVLKWNYMYDKSVYRSYKNAWNWNWKALNLHDPVSNQFKVETFGNLRKITDCAKFS